MSSACCLASIATIMLGPISLVMRFKVSATAACMPYYVHVASWYGTSLIGDSDEHVTSLNRKEWHEMDVQAATHMSYLFLCRLLGDFVILQRCIAGVGSRSRDWLRRGTLCLLPSQAPNLSAGFFSTSYCRLDRLHSLTNTARCCEQRLHRAPGRHGTEGHAACSWAKDWPRHGQSTTLVEGYEMPWGAVGS